MTGCGDKNCEYRVLYFGLLKKYNRLKYGGKKHGEAKV